MSAQKVPTSKVLYGFTLVELLIVIVILGALATIGLIAFTSSQARGRDAQRKSDLRQLASALEMYYNDFGSYPSSTNGKIAACPSTTQTVCSWGIGQLTDGNSVYMKTVPADPMFNFNYYYRTVKVKDVNDQGFQLYASLENSHDTAACIGRSCGKHTDLPGGVTCGGSVGCNFAITSTNVNPFDSN